MAHKTSFMYIETDDNTGEQIKLVNINTSSTDGATIVEYFGEFCRSIGLDPEQIASSIEEDTPSVH